MFFDTFSNRLTIEGALTAQTAVRIGAGRAIEPVGTDLPVIRDQQGHPFIPGSSFKGVLRTTVEQIARAAAGQNWGACLPTQLDEQCILRGSHKPKEWKYPEGGSIPDKPIGVRDLQQGLGDKSPAQRDGILAKRIWDNSCLACRTFGSTRLASHVKVKDLAVDEVTWFDQFQVRDGVAIDRDKGTVAGQQLYDYEVVPAGVGFGLTIVVENAEPWQWGMVWLGLQPFLQGNGAVGGFTSRGLGWMKLEKPQLTLIQPNGDPEALIDALLGQASARSATEMASQTQNWLAAFRARLVEEAGHA